MMTFRDYQVRMRLMKLLCVMLNIDMGDPTLMDALVESFDLGLNENGEIVLYDMKSEDY